MLPSGSYAEKLGRRALAMLDGARWRLGRGEYDLACFEAELAAQLYLKSTLVRVLGDAPRIHGLSELLGRLYSALRKNYPDLAESVARLASSMRGRIWFLEESYFIGRYGLADYSEEDGRECVETAEKIIDVLGRVSARVSSG